MPIKPENASKYPGGSILSKEWMEIRTAVAARAHNCCENCGVKNHSLGGRTAEGNFLPAQPKGTNWRGVEWPHEGDEYWCGPQNSGAMWLRIIRIVCTVAHVDGKLVDHSLNNLRFWCQRCHLNHDRAIRNREDLEAAGQLSLLGGE